MLQGLVVLFAMITFGLMACDSRPNETSAMSSAWETQSSKNVEEISDLTHQDHIKDDQT